jgi:hypothetical protein
MYGRVLPTPTRVVSSRLARGRWQILVCWEALPPTKSTWEDVEDFKQCYPTFGARGRALSGGRERCHGRCGQRLESLRVCDKQLDVELAIDLDLVKIWFVRDVIPDYLYPAAQGIKGS